MLLVLTWLVEIPDRRRTVAGNDRLATTIAWLRCENLTRVQENVQHAFRNANASKIAILIANTQGKRAVQDSTRGG